MEQIRKFSDERLDCFCIHCGGSTDNRDHIPSKILLDEPYPKNLPVVPSCLKCNNSYSLDEEYVACVIECVLTGSTNPIDIKRDKIKRILSNKPALAACINKKQLRLDDSVYFDVDAKRIRNVIIKLGRGHAAFENSEPRLEEPSNVCFKPIPQMSDGELSLFQKNPPSRLSLLPELGSRAFQRVLYKNAGLKTDLLASGWIIVQPERYRYAVTDTLVRIVLSEYLACVIAWE